MSSLCIHPSFVSLSVRGSPSVSVTPPSVCPSLPPADTLAVTFLTHCALAPSVALSFAPSLSHAHSHSFPRCFSHRAFQSLTVLFSLSLTPFQFLSLVLPFPPPSLPLYLGSPSALFPSASYPLLRCFTSVSLTLSLCLFFSQSHTLTLPRCLILSPSRCFPSLPHTCRSLPPPVLPYVSVSTSAIRSEGPRGGGGHGAFSAVPKPQGGGLPPSNRWPVFSGSRSLASLSNTRTRPTVPLFTTDAPALVSRCPVLDINRQRENPVRRFGSKARNALTTLPRHTLFSGCAWLLASLGPRTKAPAHGSSGSCLSYHKSSSPLQRPPKLTPRHFPGLSAAGLCRLSLNAPDPEPANRSHGCPTSTAYARS